MADEKVDAKAAIAKAKRGEKGGVMVRALANIHHPESDADGNIVHVSKDQIIEVSEDAALMLLNASLATTDLELPAPPEQVQPERRESPAEPEGGKAPAAKTKTPEPPKKK
jgi:hypothetical protein